MFKCILLIAVAVFSLTQQATATDPANGKPIPYGVFVKILKKSDVAKLDTLVSKGYDFNKPLDKGKKPSDEINDLTLWPIVNAVKSNNLPVIKYLIKHGVNLDVENEDSNCAVFTSPISTALENKNFTLFKLLVESGAHLSYKDKYESNYISDRCLYYLIDYNNFDLLKYALQHNANPNASYCFGDFCTHPMAMATKENNLDILKLLVKHGGDVNYQDPHGSSSLLIAIMNKNIKTVKYIMSNGGDASKCGNNGESLEKKSPLAYAKEIGDKDIIAELMKYNPTEACPKEEE